MNWLNSIKVPQQDESNVEESNNPTNDNVAQSTNVTN